MTARLKLGAQAIAVALVLGLLALLLWKVTHQNGGGAAAAIARGEKEPAPDFTLSRLDREGKLTLSSLRGKVVVLNFWSSWCYPCRLEAKALEAASKRWAKRVVVLGVDTWDFSGDARRFMRKYGMTYPVVHDNKGALPAKYGFLYLPETFFLNRRGLVVGHIAGQVSLDDVVTGVEEALRS
jgi:cytochrome c biogenesis protein CcmG, thiol:disulfide interchange protein DsbE